MDQPKEPPNTALAITKNGLRLAGKRRSADLNAKQLRTLALIGTGKTFKEAAMEAGYSESTASRGAAGILREWARDSDVIRDALRGIFAPEEFAARILAGCDAKEVRLLPGGSTRVRKVMPGGEIVEKEKPEAPVQVELVAWETRRRYLELLAQLAGYTEPSADDTGKSELDQIQRLYEAGPFVRAEETEPPQT